MSDPGALDKFAPAWVAALAALNDPHKAGKVNAGQRRYTYLTLPDLLAEVRAVFAQHGLALSQWVTPVDVGVGVSTRVMHTSGQSLETPPLVIRCAGDAQSVGSAITYGRRYSLAALVGLSGSDDDDGEHGTRTVTRATQRATDPDPYAGAPTPPEPPDDPPLPPHGAPMHPHTAGMPASPKQLGAIRGIAATLGVGTANAGALAHWVLKRSAPDRPDGLLLNKGEASAVIEALQGDPGKALAEQFLTERDA